MFPTRRQINRHFSILFSLIAMLWFIEIVDVLLPAVPLDYHGIRPRTIDGLYGIVFAPFLHGNFAHLIANTSSLLILGWLSMWRRVEDFYFASVSAMLIGGAGTWLFGTPNSIHIGASSVVFGLIGFLLFRGLFERRLASLLMSLVVGILFGGALIASLPPQAGISWSGHAFGFVGGIIAAKERSGGFSRR
jgi:membrane associated rhomboid family serine protease